MLHLLNLYLLRNSFKFPCSKLWDIFNSGETKMTSRDKNPPLLDEKFKQNPLWGFWDLPYKLPGLLFLGFHVFHPSFLCSLIIFLLVWMFSLFFKFSSFLCPQFAIWSSPNLLMTALFFLSCHKLIKELLVAYSPSMKMGDCGYHCKLKWDVGRVIKPIYSRVNSDWLSDTDW